MPDEITASEPAPVEAAMPLDAGQMQARLDRVPFCNFLGLTVVEAGTDGVRILASLPAESMGNPAIGAVHGGILASLLDIAATSAVSVMNNRAAITIDMRVDYHRPAFGTDFSLVGRIVNGGKTFTVAEAEVRNGDGKLVASGRALATLAAS